MNHYEEKMLILLVEKYRNSKKDSKTNVVSRRTQAKPTELYKNYTRNDGDVEEIEALNQAAQLCREKGFLQFEMKGFSNEIQKLYLADEKIEEIEEYLVKTYQYETKQMRRQYVEQILARYGGQSPAAEMECEKLRRTLGKNEIPKNYLQTEEILKALVFIEKNQKTLYLREVSMLVYGNSKYLEENVLDGVCRILRAYWKEPCREEEVPDEILQKYHIIKEKQKLCLKGNVSIWMAGKKMEIGAFEHGIEFFTDDMEKIEQIEIHTPKFITVENWTSYLRSSRQETTFFYLGGYMTRFQRDFLKLVYRDNPNLRYLHFGDIDAGGFYIHESLCKMTGVPFQMYHMSVEQLKDERFQCCLQKLTENDRARLHVLAQNAVYQETARYMLEQNVKLEQEIVSYYIGQEASGCL